VTLLECRPGSCPAGTLEAFVLSIHRGLRDSPLHHSVKSKWHWAVSLNGLLGSHRQRFCILSHTGLRLIGAIMSITHRAYERCQSLDSGGLEG
jgi:hypothetical protein